MQRTFENCEPSDCGTSAVSTSSPASADGPTLLSLPDGHEAGLFGPVPVRASHSARQGSSKAKRIPAISGPCSFGSSASASLQRSLASKLADALDVNGSPEFAMTWKRSAMPSGAPICRLAARARRISGSGCSGWPTPQTTEHQQANKRGNLKLNGAAILAGWPSPDSHRRGDTQNPESIRRRVEASKQSGPGKRQLNLQEAVQLAGWNTPRATDGDKGEPNQSGGALPADAAKCNSPPKKTSKSDSGSNQSDSLGNRSPETCDSMEPTSSDSAILTGWPTPNAMEGGSTNRGPGRNDELLLGGLLRQSFSATEKPGVLNPAFSLWLMGYPVAWASCGARAMQSCRKSRRRSSARFSTRKGA